MISADGALTFASHPIKVTYVIELDTLLTCGAEYVPVCTGINRDLPRVVEAHWTFKLPDHTSRAIQLCWGTNYVPSHPV